MATIIAASTDTHFLLNGTKYPVSYKVYPEGSLDARLEDVDGSGSIVVLAGATVGGSVRATQDALIDALAAIVSPASAGSSGGSGQTAQETANAFATAPGIAVAPGSVAALLAGPLPVEYTETAASVVSLCSGVTTTGAQAGVALPRGLKSISANLAGTGAVTATVLIEYYDGTSWHLSDTLTLSGTTTAHDDGAIDDNWPQHRANMTAVTGTAATLQVVAGI